MTVHAITSLEEFHQVINSDSVSVIDFWAQWCGPCRAISPAFEKHSEEAGSIQFYKVNIDDQPKIAEEVGIRSIPAFISYQKGEKRDEMVGASPPGLQALLTKAMAVV